MEVPSIGGKANPAHPDTSPQLKSGAISYISNLVIGV